MKLYACKNDWQLEIGEAPDYEGKVPLCSSLEKLKEVRPCISECGYVILELKEVKDE